MMSYFNTYKKEVTKMNDLCGLKPCSNKANYRAYKDKEEIWLCKEHVEDFKEKGWKIEQL